MSRSVEEFILLPGRGLRAGPLDPASRLLARLPAARPKGGGHSQTRLPVGSGIPIEVLDAVEKRGPRLVRLSVEGREEIRDKVPELRIAPVRTYHRAVAGYPLGAMAEMAASVSGDWEVTVRGPEGVGLEGARVTAVAQSGSWVSTAETSSSGRALLALPPPGVLVEELLTHPPPGFWGSCERMVRAGPPIEVVLSALGLNDRGALGYYYERSTVDLSQGVKIGIVDDGVSCHRDLTIDGGRNTVVGELDEDFHDSGQGHGTHVAGIVAAAAEHSGGVRGVAPGLPVRSYRVFPEGEWGASNYSIIKALVEAQGDGCDIVNLSLETASEDLAVADAIEDAREHGMCVIAAAGNSGGRAVTAPASCPGAIAVAAFGREGTFPPNSLAASYISARRGSDPDEFVARFSNSGSDVTCIAPGVGIPSTLPGDRYGPLSGTSMAAPVVSGLLAAALSRSSRVLSMPRSRSRAQETERLLARSATRCGFGQQFEGLGRPVAGAGP